VGIRLSTDGLSVSQTLLLFLDFVAQPAIILQPKLYVKLLTSNTLLFIRIYISATSVVWYLF